MYNQNNDTYTCDFCGFTTKWDSNDTEHGEIWSCEKCGQTFCSKCLKKTVGERKYWDIMKGHNEFLCPDCAKKLTKKKN